MASVSVTKSKVRRGTDAQRKQITLDEGELGFVTDPGKQRLFVGDGRTAGGISASMKFYAGSITSTPSAFATAQPNDLIYNTGDSKLYVLTGADFTAFSSYRYIGPAVDGVTISTNASNAYYVNSSSITLSALNVGGLPTANPGPGKLWSNSNVLTLGS
jgi:Major tropism determinant N-terminal domain